MIMSASAPLVLAIFLNNIVFLFKDHFLIDWSVSELSSVHSMLPEVRKCSPPEMTPYARVGSVYALSISY